MTLAGWLARQRVETIDGAEWVLRLAGGRGSSRFYWGLVGAPQVAGGWAVTQPPGITR